MKGKDAPGVEDKGEPEKERKHPHRGRTARARCPVVAVGASAGGIEALRVLLRDLGPDLNAAVVVLTHVSREKPTHLRDVLASFSSLRCVQVTGNTPVEPGVVYTAPSGHELGLAKGVLTLGAEDPTPPHRNIDRFLAALAAERGAGDACVILSGAGADGTAGAMRLAKAGGTVLVQDPSDALNTGMPASVIRTGMASAVMPVAMMGKHLVRLIEGAGTRGKVTSSFVEGVLEVISEHCGYELGGYRKTTLARRIRKRMILAGFDSMESYLAELKANPEERPKLLKALFIGVTEFFRDPDAFEALHQKVLPEVFRDREPDETVRVWVAGCSTGEEAYSLAMLMDEYMESSNVRCRVKIFATDIDSVAVETARKARYTARGQKGLSQARLEHYFRRDRHGYTIAPFLRERVVVVHHNLLQDPPFLHMDLVACRNLLIYFNEGLQEKAVTLLHEALNPGGFLFLGPSESATPHMKKMEVVDKRWRIFRSTGAPERKGLVSYASGQSPFQQKAAAVAQTRQEQSPAAVMAEALERRYARPAVLVDRDFSVLHSRGDITPFLKMPSGEPSLNVLKLADPQLRHHLRMALRSVLASGEPAVVLGPKLQGLRGAAVNIVVDPVKGAAGQLSSMLVVFEQCEEPRLSGANPALAGLTECGVVQRYESELQASHDQLREVVARDEALNEELRASNEELLSMNEELQSANEEMDASREELQALNEELSLKLEELSRANSFVESLLRSTNVATVFLDSNLCVVRSTPQALDIFHLAVQDRGRPISGIKPRVDDAHLMDDIRQVLDGRELTEREVAGPGGRCYLRRVFPFRTGAAAMEGVVLTYSDVTTLKEAEKVLMRSKEDLEALVSQRSRELIAAREEAESRAGELEALMEQTPAAIWITRDTQARVIVGNPAGYRLLGMEPGANVSKSGPGSSPPYRPVKGGRELKPEELPLQRAARGETVTGEEIDLALPDGSILTILGNAAPLRDAQGEPSGAVGVFLDYTEFKAAVAGKRKAEMLFQLFMDNAPSIAWMKDEEGRHVYLNARYEAQFGVRQEDWKGRTDFELWPSDIAQVFRENDLLVLSDGVARVFTERTVDAGGKSLYWHNSKFLVIDEGGRRYIGGVGVNITERVELEQALKATADSLVLALEAANAGTWEWIPATNENIWSERLWPLYGLNPALHKPSYHSWREAIHPACRAEAEATVNSALAKGQEVSVEWRVNLPGDEERWLLSRGRARLAPDGTVERYMGIVLDISERKRAEKKLQALASQLELALTAANMGWWHYDPQTKVATWDERYKEIFGVEGFQRPNEEILARIHPDDLPGVWSRVEAALDPVAPKPYTASFRIRRHGEERWIEAHGIASFSGEGKARKAVSFVGTVLDITESVASARLLAEREGQLRLFAFHAPASVAMFDADMRYLVASNRWLEEYGLTGDIIGRSHYEIFPEIPERWKAIHRRCLAGAVEREENDPFVRADGHTQWISWEIRPWRTATGEVGGIVVFSQDVTERKQHEEVITASLREKEVLLREIHHRVKNNLQIISSLLSLQEQSLDDLDTLDVLAESRGRVTSMALIHEQLYHSSSLSEIRVDHYIQQLLPRLISAYQGERDIGLMLKLEPVSLSIDQAIPFGLIINELVTNALKHGFRERDGGTVTVSSSVEEEAVCFVVQDDGAGLPQGFDLATAVSLGLQIVSMLAEQLHGKLGVESSGGTRFKLCFPLQRSISPGLRPGSAGSA